MQPMDEIYQKYAQTVYKYILSKAQERDVAEELTQETFYQAIRSIDRYDESCKITTWLCGIAKNVLRTYLRKHPEHDDVEEMAIATDSVEKDVVQAAERIELFKKLHDVEEPYKEVIYLRVFGGLSFREIGEIHEKSENWARVTFYRGKEKLRKEVEIDE
ncbi:MAG: sigma-70 family RNA polymerase sigma factor [Eubacterium sp.]|nr:sigma-70 family RNA polymerase sigma factor [Eubacterium sp.]